MPVCVRDDGLRCGGSCDEVPVCTVVLAATWGIEVAVCVEVLVCVVLPATMWGIEVTAASVVPVCGVVAATMWGIEVPVYVGAAC